MQVYEYPRCERVLLRVLLHPAVAVVRLMLAWMCWLWAARVMLHFAPSGVGVRAFGWAIATGLAGLLSAHEVAVWRLGFRRAFPTRIELYSDRLRLSWAPRGSIECDRADVYIVPKSEFGYFEQVGARMLGLKWVACRVRGGRQRYIIGNHLPLFETLVSELFGTCGHDVGGEEARATEIECAKQFRRSIQFVLIGGPIVALVSLAAVLAGRGSSAWLTMCLAVLGVVLCWAFCFRLVPRRIVLGDRVMAIQSQVTSRWLYARDPTRISVTIENPRGGHEYLRLSVGDRHFILTSGTHPDLRRIHEQLSQWLARNTPGR